MTTPPEEDLGSLQRDILLANLIRDCAAQLPILQLRQAELFKLTRDIQRRLDRLEIRR